MDFSHLAVEFFMDARLNKRKSDEAGRPIYDDVEKVRIRTAGDPKNVFVSPAHAPSCVRDPATNKPLTYAELHAAPYEAFQRNIEYRGSGTPLSEAPFVSAGKRRELEALGVMTVEALAGLEGTNLGRLGMGGRELKTKAEAWLAKASGSAETTRLVAELAAMREELDRLRAGQVMTSGPATIEPEPAAPGVPSPFADWDDETIKLWITEQGGDKPDGRLGHDKLVALADTLNAELAARTKAA